MANAAKPEGRDSTRTANEQTRRLTDSNLDLPKTRSRGSVRKNRTKKIVAEVMLKMRPIWEESRWRTLSA